MSKLKVTMFQLPMPTVSELYLKKQLREANPPPPPVQNRVNGEYFKIAEIELS